MSERPSSVTLNLWIHQNILGLNRKCGDSAINWRLLFWCAFICIRERHRTRHQSLMNWKCIACQRRSICAQLYKFARKNIWTNFCFYCASAFYHLLEPVYLESIKACFPLLLLLYFSRKQKLSVEQFVRNSFHEEIRQCRPLVPLFGGPPTPSGLFKVFLSSFGEPEENSSGSTQLSVF